MGKQWKQCQTLFFGALKISADGDRSHEIKRCLLLGKESYDQPRQHIKKQRHYFANKDQSSQGYGFSSIICNIPKLETMQILINTDQIYKL